MPESRSSCWMTFSLGMAGLGVVMGITVFFVFRSVVTPLNKKTVPLYWRWWASVFYPISNPAFCTATSTLVCGRLGVGFLLPSFSTCTSSSWTTGGVVQLLFSSFLLSPSFIQASHMAHRAQPCCQQEPRPSHLSIQVFTWSLINFLLALYGAQFSLAHLEISHPTQSNLIYLKNI